MASIKLFVNTKFRGFMGGIYLIIDRSIGGYFLVYIKYIIGTYLVYY